MSDDSACHSRRDVPPYRYGTSSITVSLFLRALVSMRLSIFGCLGLLPYSIAIPVLDTTLQHSLESRAACTANTAAVYDPACWDQLDIPDYLKQWNATVPRCRPDQDGSTCCNPSVTPNEPWSTCFLRLALNDSSIDCTEVNSKTCDMEPFTLRTGIPNAAQARYAVRNILGMHKLLIY